MDKNKFGAANFLRFNSQGQANFNFSYFGLCAHEDFASNFNFSQGGYNGQEVGVQTTLYINLSNPH